jgi:5-formyltetrahydrofolate cyclo-ligase
VCRHSDDYVTKVRRREDRLANEAKTEVRERVWSLLERERAGRFPGTRGRIPNFVGAEAAAEHLAATPEWQAARVVKANPDAPQLSVRRRALRDGKTLFMAVPRLREAQPFVLVDVDPTISRAMSQGRPVALGQMERVELVVCGTVAVNHDGVRIGKGGGYSDLELGLLLEEGLVDERTVLATTLHPLQILDEPLPETEHDFRVDLIVTPDEVIRAPRRHRPPGILWEHLDEEKIAAIPALVQRRERAR